MPPKRYHSRFPTARIKKIMQLDDDVGKVAAAVPLLVSRAVELFLFKVLTGTAEFADKRGAKTITASHLKYMIDHEPRFNFLKEETGKFPDVVGKMEEEEPEKKKRGRKRAELVRESSEKAGEASSAKRKKRESPRKKGAQEKKQESSASESGSDVDSPELSMAHSEAVPSKRAVIASTGLSPKPSVGRASVIQSLATSGRTHPSSATTVPTEPGSLAASHLPLTATAPQHVIQPCLPSDVPIHVTQEGLQAPGPPAVRSKQKTESRK